MAKKVKILRATGAVGKREDGWNWCQPLEPAWAHGGKCCSSPECGCGISFHGLFSALATTHGVVAEIPAKRLDAVIREFEQIQRLTPTTTVLDPATKQLSEPALQRVLQALRNMPDYLDEFPPGTVLCLEKIDEDRFQLIAQATSD